MKGLTGSTALWQQEEGAASARGSWAALEGGGRSHTHARCTYATSLGLGFPVRQSHGLAAQDGKGQNHRRTQARGRPCMEGPTLLRAPPSISPETRNQTLNPL